jgi:hypothetical protein
MGVRALGVATPTRKPKRNGKGKGLALEKEGFSFREGGFLALEKEALVFLGGGGGRERERERDLSPVSEACRL